MSESSVHVGEHLVPVRRALISASDKTGLADFATALVKEFGVELISTGGTAKFLRDAGLKVTDVSEVTGFPEMMDGRVKTLHPKIHGGLLSLRDNPEHAAAMKAHGIQPIDLVVINLYPFKKTIEKPGVTFEEAIENIDIGGPSMVRSAAKNHHYVLVITSPDRYEKALGDLRKHNGASCAQHRLKMAQQAFAHTAEYDALIANYLRQIVDKPKRELPSGSTGGAPARFLQSPYAGAVAIAAATLPETEDDDREAQHRHLFVRRLIESASWREFVNNLLTMQAVSVGATEAAAFSIESSKVPGKANLQGIAHIRPDQSTPEIRAAAIKAFTDLITPCVEQKRDGALEVADTGNGDSQFCLITLLKADGETTAATAVVTRCKDLEAARKRLTTMQRIADYSEAFAMRNRGSKLFDQRSATSELPKTLHGRYELVQPLRYGENPHQKAAMYANPSHPGREASVARAKQHHGKELSYINLLDADAALSVVKEFADQAVCIVKHATPCGAAAADDLATAFEKAYASDPIAAFGGIVAVNRAIDEKTAARIVEGHKFLEVVVAPGYAPAALETLKSRWKNVRLLEVAGDFTPDPSELSMHNIVGGILIQERDLTGADDSAWKIVSQRQPTAAELADMKFAWLACKHVKSNAIVIVKDRATVGVGGGQVDRVNASRIAVAKAGDRARGAVVASDAFFPFPDGPELLLNAGVTAIIHPGGSVKDQETIDLVKKRGATMVLTGQRHFRH